MLESLIDRGFDVAIRNHAGEIEDALLDFSIPVEELIGSGGGEARLRVHGEKMEQTALPPDEWNQVIEGGKEFWDEVAAESPRAARVVEIFKEYASDMEKAGYPYR